jgi:predicted SprT family Zn-dependent metalloprotease
MFATFQAQDLQTGDEIRILHGAEYRDHTGKVDRPPGLVTITIGGNETNMVDLTYSCQCGVKHAARLRASALVHVQRSPR